MFYVFWKQIWTFWEFSNCLKIIVEITNISYKNIVSWKLLSYKTYIKLKECNNNNIMETYEIMSKNLSNQWLSQFLHSIL